MRAFLLRAVRAGALGLCIVAMSASHLVAQQPSAEVEWKAGAAKTVITPKTMMWMAGYAARNKPAEGVEQDLYAKALALEDARGARLVIVTLDLIGVPRRLREAVETEAKKRYGLEAAQLLLNASHTHCGPELRADKASVFGLGGDRIAQAQQYLAELQVKILAVIGEALEALAPAQLRYTHARCGFAMNRRLPTETGIRNSPNPDGPVDHDVPILRIEDPQGRLRAVVFGYACHNTTLAFYRFCGDYAGYAQQFIEEAHPGVVALFVMGCGGDQNPYPRRTVELAKQHGRALANAVETGLEVERPWFIHGPLQVAYDEVVLEFAEPPSREELLELKQSRNRYDRRHAELLLEQLETQGRINVEYPYPVQVVRLGDALLLVALAGETVVDYSLRLKRDLPVPAVWVAGYSNDVFGYVPSLRVLKEGGYEGGGAFRYTALPGPFAPSVEERILGKVKELAARVGVAAGSAN